MGGLFEIRELLPIGASLSFMSHWIDNNLFDTLPTRNYFRMVTELNRTLFR